MRFLLALCILCSTPIVNACLWDLDTLAMERRRFPDVYELIVGKFLRHSPEFYEWRIQDRLNKLKGDKSQLAWYDDLAVAYDKIGDQDLAIATMEQKLIQLAKKPATTAATDLETGTKKANMQTGLYETHANLGTFLIHSGEFEKGLVHIRKAIEINPDAHFGREIYQQLLVEYVLANRKDGKLNAPIEPKIANPIVGDSLEDEVGFVRFVLLQREIDRKKNMKAARQEIDRAIKGVAGMMRFGHFDSPVLLEVMGDLLSANADDSAARRLAARAYLKASYHVRDQAAKKAFREKSKAILFWQHENNKQLAFEKLEERLRDEIKDADKWYNQIRDDELKWIADPKLDPDVEYKKKYFDQPQSKRLNPPPVFSAINVAFVCLSLALTLGLYQMWQKYKSQAKSNRVGAASEDAAE